MSGSGPGVAVLGSGMWGQNHVRVWNELGLLRVVCDPDVAALDRVRERFPDVEVGSDPNEVFARSDIDAVVIATPAATHAAVALAAMESGKHVLIEKPMAMTAAEGEEVVQAAARTGRIVTVGHVLEYHPAVLKMAELIEAGELGQVRYVSANRLNMGRIRTEENALWSFAPHDIAIMLRLLKSEPEEVACHGGAYLNLQVADVTMTNLRFPGGVRGHIYVSWLHPFKEHRFVVVGDRQMAVFDDTLPWSEKLVLYPHQVDWIEGRTPMARKAEAVAVPLDQAEPLRAECEDFVKSIEGGQPPLADAASGLAVLRVLEAAQRSLERDGAPEPLVVGASAAAGVHPTAVVDAGASIGPGTRIWHFSHVMGPSVIGRDCNLGQNVFVGANVTIGDRVKVQNNVSIYEGVELEDEVFCGPSMVFTNVIDPRSGIEKKDEFRRTLVKKGATLGANCTVICGVTVGEHSMVGAGAVVSKDVEDYALVTGVPAIRRGWVCECGARLGDFPDRATCSTCGRAYVRTGERIARA